MSWRIAEKQAKKSTYLKHRVGAVITKGDRILSTGYNELRYTGRFRLPTLHAEASAIKKLLDQNRLSDLVGSTLYVTRFTKAGAVACSKPCHNCESLCKSVGIRTVRYIDSLGRPAEMRL